jgi:hypothetical protein
MLQRIDSFRGLMIASFCTLAGVVSSPAQNLPPDVSLRPVDTGRSVIFDLSGPRPDIGRLAVKTNLIWALGLQTPNLALEYKLDERGSIEAAAGYNHWGNLWDFSETGPDYDPENRYKRQLDHFFVKAEYHYWFRRPFDGHFVGAGLFYAKYSVGKVYFPGLFAKDSFYYGNAFGGALTGGWWWRLNSRWVAEFSLGIGVAALAYDTSSIRIDSENNGSVPMNPVRWRKTYFGLTSAGIKLVFTII